jgi:hypothetical protein
MHYPFRHAEFEGQFTLEQFLATHDPPWQSWLSGHETPSHISTQAPLLHFCLLPQSDELRQFIEFEFLTHVLLTQWYPISHSLVQTIASGTQVLLTQWYPL